MESVHARTIRNRGCVRHSSLRLRATARSVRSSCYEDFSKNNAVLEAASELDLDSWRRKELNGRNRVAAKQDVYQSRQVSNRL